jgi:superfamily II DNA or RNA helicase
MQCKIIIRDEVNCKIEGLDLDTRRRLVAKFKYDVPNARYLPAVRLGRWDGKQAYFQLGGSSYVALLPQIIEYLADRNWQFDLVDQRPARQPYEFTEVDEQSFAHINWPPGHVAAGKPIVLRDYQKEIINRFLNDVQSIQEVATGAGKTIMTAVLSHKVEPYGRSIVIVPNKDLVRQTEADYKNLALDVGVYFGERKELYRTHTICTWQSLNIMLKNTQEHTAGTTIHEFLAGVVCVIVDEVHQAKADVLKSLLTGVMADIPIRWGLTGTIPKEDYEKVALTVSLGQVTGQLSASELQQAGVLANCHVNIIQTTEHSDFTNYQNELKYLTTNNDRLDYLSGLIAEINRSGNTLVLVDRISAGEELVARIPNSVFVSGNMDSDDRKEQYDQVADVDDKIIIATYGVAAVGINIPRIFNLVLLEPGKSFVRVIQSIGRGIRKAEDKDFVQIWDVTADCKFAKRHLTKRKAFYREANYPFTQEKITYK